MFTNIISDKANELLKKIPDLNLRKDFFLVGGTSLALQLGHRKSDDLDFFTHEEFKASIVEKLRGLDEFKAINVADNAVEVCIGELKLMLIYWAYDLEKPLKDWRNIKLADPLDIGYMKLLALQGRSRKKDIVDLYYIDKKVIKLENLLERFERSYLAESFGKLGGIKTLIDRKALKKDKMPEIFEDLEWEEIFDYVTVRIKKHIKELISSK